MYETTVIALDPGLTTGYASGYVEDGQLKVITGQDTWSHLDLYSQLGMMKPNWIVIESFEFRRKAREGLELYSRELIGVVHLYVEQHKGEVELEVQQPGTIMFAFKDEMLENEGLYKPGKPHANDAARHICYWFTFGRGYQFNKRGYTSGA